MWSSSRHVIQSGICSRRLMSTNSPVMSTGNRTKRFLQTAQRSAPIPVESTLPLRFSSHSGASGATGNGASQSQPKGPSAPLGAPWAKHSLSLGSFARKSTPLGGKMNNGSTKSSNMSQNTPQNNSATSATASATASATGTKKPRRKLRPLKAVITLSPSAVAHLKALLDQPEPKMIRIGVKNKGCSGLAYDLEYVSEAGKFDEEVVQDGVKVLVDSKALFTIIGSQMDWVEDKLSAKFVFHNPNSKGSCGCGESFMV